MNPLDRFTNRATTYAKYRPSYPTVAIDQIFARLGVPTSLTVADVGAGTGISARLLAERGAKVWAIEPNAAMRAAATDYPGVTNREGTAEATGLSSQSVDLVTCFQSFHWFEPETSLVEFHRILLPQGRLALIWNDKDLTDPFTAAYRNLICRASHNNPAEGRFSKALSFNTLGNSPLFCNLRQHSFLYRQTVDLETLIGRTQSISYIPLEGDDYEQLVTDLIELYNLYRSCKNTVDLVHTTNLFWADAV